jgi:nucleotide-binding universal stress UspA family protein
MVKILIPIDGSQASLKALTYVTTHAKVFGTDLALMYVHLPVPSGRAASWVGRDVVEAYYTEESDDALAPNPWESMPRSSRGLAIRERKSQERAPGST